MYLALLLLWYVVGVAGFVFWWTRDYDLTTHHIVNACLAGVMGPISFVVGFLIHGESWCGANKVIFKKRSTH